MCVCVLAMHFVTFHSYHRKRFLRTRQRIIFVQKYVRVCVSMCLHRACFVCLVDFVCFVCFVFLVCFVWSEYFVCLVHFVDFVCFVLFSAVLLICQKLQEN